MAFDAKAILLGGFLTLQACSGENSSSPFLSQDQASPNPATPSPTAPTSPVLQGVEETVKGTWRVLAGTYRGDTARLTADSLVWGSPPKINMVTSLFPTTSGKRLYAAKGFMGLSDGKGTDRDTVRYEYERSGDTLWLEYRTPSNAGFGVDKGSLYSWPLLRAP